MGKRKRAHPDNPRSQTAQGNMSGNFAGTEGARPGLKLCHIHMPHPGPGRATGTRNQKGRSHLVLPVAPTETAIPWHSAHVSASVRIHWLIRSRPVASVLFSCGRKLDDAQEDPEPAPAEARNPSGNRQKFWRHGTTPRNALLLGHCLWVMTSCFPAVYKFSWRAVLKKTLSIELFSDLRALFYPNG